jgi:hypothetical protein
LLTYERSWEYVSEIIKNADPLSAEHKGEGVRALQALWEKNKGWMKPFFGEDGRITVEVPSTVEADDIVAAFQEAKRIANKLSQKPKSKYCRVFMQDYGESAFDCLKYFLTTKVTSAEMVENKLAEKRPDPARPEKSLPKGTKVSKYLNSWISSDSNNELYEIYGIDNASLILDFLNDVYSQMLAALKRENDYVVISINPVDMLLMANHSASDWKSCHRILPVDGNGAHRCGCISYLCDAYTVVAFAYRSEARVWRCSFDMPLKLWRQMIMFDKERLGAFCGREYPNHISAYARAARGLAAGVLAKYGAVEPKWKIKKLHHEAGVNSDPDPDPNNGAESSALENNPYHWTNDSARVALRMNSGKYPRIRVGAPAIPCINCGTMRDDKNNARLVCWRCTPREHCDHCGTRLSGGGSDAHTPGNNKYYCKKCFEELWVSCPDCNNYYLKTECIKTGDNKLVCPDCIKRNYVKCTGCNKHHNKGKVVAVLGEKYCSTCYENNVGQCDKCQVKFLKHKTEHLLTEDGYLLCKECSTTMHKCQICNASFVYDYTMINGMCGECANKAAVLANGKVEVTRAS